jgi:phosphatidylglycerophosphatase A
MNIDRRYQFYATLGPIGYLPASGTCATLITIIALFFIPYTFGWWYLGFLLLGYIGAYILIKKGLIYFIENDPSQIVLDEVLGCLVTFYAIPISGISLVFGFLLFRFFDITKFGPVGWFEKINGASGIILDDVAAGLVSNIILRFIVYVCIP